MFATSSAIRPPPTRAQSFCEALGFAKGFVGLSGVDEVLSSRRVAGSVQESLETTPLVMPGYCSLPEDPVSIYKCQEEEACGGGPPASCTGGRISLTCTRCPGGFFLGTDRFCHMCEGYERAVIMMLVPFGILGLTVAHVAVNWPVSKASQWTMSCVFLVAWG